MKKTRERTTHRRSAAQRIVQRTEKRRLFLLILASVLAGSLVLLFVVLPLLRGNDGIEVNADGMINSAITVVAGAVGDLSKLQREAVIKYTSINAPYFYDGKIAFSTTSGSILYNKLYLYDTVEETYEEIPVKVKYDNILDICMNEAYIVYLDSSNDGGGRICVYDRAAGDWHVVKEYAYALPQIALEGEYIAFLQQAGAALDRLYLFNLRTKESVTVKTFVRMSAVSPRVYLENGVLIYSVSYYENAVLTSRVVELSLATGQEQFYEWGRYVYAPQKSGIYMAFLSSATGVNDNIYLSENGGTPVLLVEDVVNFAIGDGFLAYTKEDNVYVYVFEKAKTYRLNTDISKGLLSGADGRNVCWYDVTNKKDVDIVKYAVVEWK